MALGSGAQPISVLENWFGGSFESGFDEQQITTMMLKAGPGSRGVVYVTNGGVGHVFNAVNEGGVVRFLDFQVGEPGGFEDWTDASFLWTFQP